MKTFATLSAGILLFCHHGFTQFTEDFNKDIAALTSKCWKFKNVNSSFDASQTIDGGSVYTNPPTSGSEDRTITTPFLNIKSTSLTVSFNYKPSNKIAGQATRTIEIGLVDSMGIFISLQTVSLDKNSPTSLVTFNSTYTVVPGIYRLELRVGGQTGDGNSRLFFESFLQVISFVGYCWYAILLH